MRLFSLSSSILNNKSNKYSRPIIRLTIAGVALGVVIMVIAVAITSGYKKAIRDKVSGMGSHIRISNYDQNYSFDAVPFSKNQFFLETLRQNPEISNIQFYITKVGILKTGDQVEGVVLKGVDNSFSWDIFSAYILQGEKLSFQKDTIGKQILISQKYAQKLHLKVGEKVAAYFVQDPPKQRNFTICGIYETGIPDYDDQMALVDMRQIQQLNGWDSNSIGGMELRIKSYRKIDEMGEYVHQNVGYDLKAETIKALYPNIFQWIGLFDTNVIVLMIITTFVCIITIISSFFIIVLEETKTIGILKTLGMETKKVFHLFLLMGIQLIVKGLIYGNIVAFSLCFLQYKFHFIKLDAANYYLSFVPIEFPIGVILAVNVGVFLLCLATLSLPALYISKKITPVNAIRFD